MSTASKRQPEKAKAAWHEAWKAMRLELRCQKCGKTYSGNVMTPCPHCGEKIK